MSRWEVIHGDCRTALPWTGVRVDALISDPPYGMGWDTDSRRYTGDFKTYRGKMSNRGQGKDWPSVYGDGEPFDPSPWLANFDKAILWGANHYAQRLPLGTTLVWIKKGDHLFGTFLSDAELGWMRGGYGVYCCRVSFPPPSRIAENDGEGAAHPTQKPIELMRWCIKRLNLAPDSLILDPYCGSGTTGVAAVMEGHRFIGIEREAQYVEIARRRIADAAAQGSLFELGERSTTE